MSNVLNTPQQVAEATRRRVEAAIAVLQFERNSTAHALRAECSRP